MKLKYICIISLSFLALACERNEDPVNNVDNPDGETIEEKKTDVFFTPYAEPELSPDSYFTTYWGTAQKADVKLLGNSFAKDHPVIDFKKLYADFPDYFMSANLFSSEYYWFCANDPSEYLEKTAFNKNCIGELLKPAKLNQKGRLFLEIANRRDERLYKFMIISSVQKEIGEKYFLPTFIRALYGNSIDKVIDEYGTHILTNFSTGYQTVFFYTGMYKGDASPSDQKNEFSTYISEAVHREETKEADGKTGYAEYIYTEKAKRNPNITDIEISIQNIGGGGEFKDLSHLKNLDEIKVHLTPWASTFNRDHTTVMPYGKNGLTPIYNFFLEENFKERAKEYIEHNTTQEPVRSPHIEIANNVESTPRQLEVYLITRFGDYVLLNTLPYSTAENPTLLADSIKREKQEIYGINISYKETSSKPSKIFSFNDLEESRMKKYTDKNTGMMYLLYSEKQNLYAFSIYNEAVLDSYGIKKWISAMPETEKASLRRYTVIGL